MKTLKELAAEHNLYQLNDIPPQWCGEYCRKDGGREIPDFLKNLQGYEVGNFFKCKIQDKGTPKELYFIEYHTEILLKKNGSDLLIRLNEDTYRKKYTFYPYWDYLHKYHNISYYKKQDALKNLKEPDQIGIFSEKKVEDWVKYCHDYIKIMDNLYNEVEEKNAVIEKDIQNFINSLEGCKVSTYQNKTYIETDLFEIQFEHFKDQNYLSQNITFKGTLQDIVKINSQMLVKC